MKKVRVFVPIEFEIQGIEILEEVHTKLDQLNSQISDAKIFVDDVFNSEIVEIDDED